jgi:uncharacterized Tic20 family protein
MALSTNIPPYRKANLDPRVGKLAWDILFAVVPPLAISFAIITWISGAHFGDSSATTHTVADPLPPLHLALIYVTILKLTSIAFLGWHTQTASKEISQNSSRSFNYRITALYMVVMAVVLAIQAVMLYAASDPTNLHGNLGAIIKLVALDPWAVHIISLAAFAYMGIFLANNMLFRHRNRYDLGVNLFTSAFIYGTNIPFLLAFLVLWLTTIPGFVHFYGSQDQCDVFFAGAVAFLVYSSTVASVCIDHYARPLLFIN